MTGNDFSVEPLWNAEWHQKFPTGNYWPTAGKFKYAPLPPGPVTTFQWTHGSTSPPIHQAFFSPDVRPPSSPSVHFKLTWIRFATCSPFPPTSVFLLFHYEVRKSFLRVWKIRTTWHLPTLVKAEQIHPSVPKRNLLILWCHGLALVTSVTHHRNYCDAPGNYRLRKMGATCWMEEEKDSLQIRSQEKK